MKRVGAGATAGLAVVLAAATVWGQGAPPPPQEWSGARRPEMREGMRPWAGRGEEMLLDRLVNDPKIAEELLLSSEQVEALKKMRMDVQTEMITLNADRDKAALKQAELMSAEQPDLEAVLKAVEEVGTLQTKIAKLRVKTLLEAKKVLTPEQLQKAKEMFSERMRERREQMMQQRGDRRRSERPAGPPPNPGPVEPPPIQ